MEKQTAGRKALGDFAPKFAELNDDVLFGEVWSREDKLCNRDRCLITVSCLISKGISDASLKYHILNAKAQGVTKTEMIEVLTHLAFYAGWPNVWAAFPYVKEVYAEEKSAPSDSLFGLGEENKAYEQYFIGKSYLKPLSVAEGLGVYNVTFEPGCRIHDQLVEPLRAAAHRRNRRPRQRTPHPAAMAAAGARRAGIVTVHALHSTARVCRVPGSAGRLRRAEAAYTRPGFRVPAWA